MNASIKAAFSKSQHIVDEFLTLESKLTSNDVLNRHTVIATVHKLIGHLYELEQLGVSRSEILAVVLPIRELHGRSPLIRRMQDWPRGYPGDFEIVELIMSGKCISDQGTLPYYLERYILDCPASQQHRNKVAVQSSNIRSVMLKKPEGNILVLGCGSSLDVKMAADDAPGFVGQLWLNDIDQEALLSSSRRLSDCIAPECTTFVHSNVVAFLRNASSIPQFDLIVAGGLCDYLDDRILRFVLKRSYSLLKENGRLFFTNIGRGNPYRPWMEYCGDWFLIEREPECLVAACSDSGIPVTRIRLSQDSTGLTHLAHATKCCVSDNSRELGSCPELFYGNQAAA